MPHSFEFSPEEKFRIRGISDAELDQVTDFFKSAEGHFKVAHIAEKDPENVTFDDAIEAYSKYGIFLFSKEIKLDEMTPQEKAIKELEWQDLLRSNEETDSDSLRIDTQDPDGYSRAA